MTSAGDAVEAVTPLGGLLRAAPIVSRPGVADERMTEFDARLTATPHSGAMLGDARVRALLRGIADGSPYLWSLVMSDPERCAVLLDRSPDQSLATILGDLEAHLVEAGPDPARAMRALRLGRQAVALLVGLADLGGVWPLHRVTDALTRFAEGAVAGALATLVRAAVRDGKLTPGTVPATCGLTVLALGKAGGRELNYSSDIDLVVLFDPNAPTLADNVVAAPFYVRMTQALARLLQERTGDGFVLRVDLRLRPDPASTAVAIAIPAAFRYYENLGQNWERAAFIKARPIAGDLGLGAGFLDEMAPFIWRKYFDYAAIADIHAMKRQIHAVRGQASVGVLGHDLKLGRGGIREIEFFVQTQQLIFGGRRPTLRGPQTLAMLDELAADGWIGAEARDELRAAYGFLRTTEHRLQMVGDQQTQKLPADPEALGPFANFCGYPDAATFSSVLLQQLGAVERHYARLFETAPSLSAVQGSLVFTGTDPDAATVATLRAMGYERPEHAVELVRGWHFGRRAAVRSPRAREVVTELVPALLDAFSRSGDPDGALASFDTILGRASSAIELLSLLRSHSAIRELFADILGSAPRLAETVSQRPHLLDAVVDPTLLGDATSRAPERIAAALANVGSTEDFLDRMRDTAAEELFLVGVRTLAITEDVAEVERARTDVADAIIRAALDRVLADLKAQHGRVPGSGCVVLGMGKLGSRELTATSDLDLMVIYRVDPAGPDSDGARPLEPTTYYARVTQRLIASLTVPTRRGRLYDVDVRLRPSGRQGPVAIRFSAFKAYQDSEAQTWEHMALTRARIVAGDPDLAHDVEVEIARILGRPRDLSDLRRDVAAMRTLVAGEKPARDVWDFKLAAGGLLDIEFAAQYLQLAFAHRHPALCRRHPLLVLDEAARLGLDEPARLTALNDAYRLQSRLAQIVRLLVGEPVSVERLGAGGVRRLCEAAHQPGPSQLEALLIDVRATVRAHLEDMLERRI